MAIYLKVGNNVHCSPAAEYSRRLQMPFHSTVYLMFVLQKFVSKARDSDMVAI
jgi:hypothetical protein